MANVFEPVTGRSGEPVFEPASTPITARANEVRSCSTPGPVRQEERPPVAVFEPMKVSQPTRTMMDTQNHGSNSSERTLKNISTLFSVLNCAIGVYKLFSGDPSGIHHLTGGDSSGA